MDNPNAEAKTNFVELTAEVVSAYVANNSVQTSDIAAIIASVHSSLVSLGQARTAPEGERPQPAVSVKKSISPDYLISLEDGRRYKSLKRHLSGRGLTPEQYREKWGLPADYPMVAPNYAKQRSELAKSMGLGRRTRDAEIEPEMEQPEPEPVAVSEPEPELDTAEAAPAPKRRRGPARAAR